jgi:hypothetical protein
MKTLAIFPSIAILLTILTLLHLSGRVKIIVAIIVSALVAGLFYLYYWFVPIYSLETLMFVLYVNFISAIIVIPCLTYLGYSFLPKVKGLPFWIKLIGVAAGATLVTGAAFATTLYFSLMNNPMHPIPV